MTDPLMLVGSIGSPYSRKLRAVVRYRRIPFQWVGHGSKESAALPEPPLPLLPVLHFPTGPGYEATSDTTFQVRRLEAEYRQRSVIPADPVIAMLDFLIEDYTDEWVTKMMFHYRWAIEENVVNANRTLPRWMPAIPEKMANTFPETFGKRQVNRLGVVGSNEATAPVIEASYRRLLEILEQHLQLHAFVMGARPGTADFGLFGQLSQLAQVEPTSRRLCRETAYRVIPWCENVEDLSGIEVTDDDWFARDALPETFRALLGEIGRSYAPFLLANAEALASGADAVECAIDGARWTQTPFKYQGKCLEWLRESHAALSDAERGVFDDILAGTGCEAIFR